MHTQTQSSFAIDGMFCGGCAATVERALGRVEGVKAVSVSFVSDAALVRHERNVSLAQLTQIITGLGYGVRPLNEADHDEDEGGDYAARNAFFRSHQIRLAVAICFGMWTMLASLAGYLGQIPTHELAWWVALVSGLLALPVLTYSGSAFYRLGWRSIRARAPGMEALITLAVAAATTVSVVNLIRGSTLVYFDAAIMLITFQLIARITDFSVRRRAGDAVRRLLRLAPETARRITDSGSESIHPRDLELGDIIETRPGERLAADGAIRFGTSQLDTSLITGESKPRQVGPGDTVLAGTQVLNGLLRVEVSAAGGKREIDALATEVRRLIVGKGSLARLADKVAFWLLPTIIIAAILALVLALLTGAGWQAGISHALAVMIVTCPCALSLAVPLVQTASASAAAKRGIVLRDPGALEKASRIDTVLFDKTGTITFGEPRVTTVHCMPGYTEHDVIAAAVKAERGSNHPLAKAIRNYAAKQTPTEGDFKELAGRGVEATDENGNAWRVGSASWFHEIGLTPVEATTNSNASRVEVAINNSVLGAIEFSDALRPDAASMIQQLKQRG
ncbi:MAG TPA: cation-translocating P-type ATPase, partial [Gammaproteobacteria bacterium]|nr:cation-translocating P-type ATPase [Gammaproteobacteria bacterium]